MAIPSEVRERITKDFPHLSYLLDNPEMEAFWNDIYERASNQGISDTEFAQLLWQTQWFQSRSDSARKWDTIVSQDPGEAERRREKERFKLRNLATQWGIPISAQQVEKMVEHSLRWGLTNDEIEANLATYAGSAGGPIHAGTIRATEDQIVAIARSYLQNISAADANKYARDILAHKMTLDSMKVMFRDMAKQEFPHLAQRLEMYDMHEITGGLRNQLASLLDMPIETIDLGSDRYSHLLNVPGADGEMGIASRTDVGIWARQQPEFKQSKQGQDLSSRLITGLAGAFGRGL